MPDGHLQRIDEQEDQAIVVRNGRRFVARIGDVESAARVPGARVHFDIDRRSGIDEATNVRLSSGTRTNKRQRRFGDLTGAKLPGAKVKSTSSHIGVDVTTQSLRVINAWLEAMAESRFADATSLYAPNALLHGPMTTKAGRKAIRSVLEDEVWTAIRDLSETNVSGFDQLVHVRMEDGGRSESEWFEVHRGSILEHWHQILPDTVGELEEGPTISIIRTGEIDDLAENRLRQDLQRVVKRLARPVEEVRVKIDAPTTSGHPYSVSAALHAGTVHVRSHVAAPTLLEAIDNVCSRLERQVDRVADRSIRPPDQHRPDGESWRHGDRPSPQDLMNIGPTTSDQEIVRHKSWGPQLSTIDEAIWDMEQADYDFYLFTEAESRTVGIVWHGADGLRAQLVTGQPSAAPSDLVEMDLTPAPTMSIDVAKESLNEFNAPFIFAVTPKGDPFVLYRRYDGHLGLIEPMPLLDDAATR